MMGVDSDETRDGLVRLAVAGLVAGMVLAAGVGCDAKGGSSESSSAEAPEKSAGQEPSGEEADENEGGSKRPPVEAHCKGTKVAPGVCKEFYVVMDGIKEKCKAEKGTWSEGKCPREKAVGICDRKERVEVYYEDDFDAKKAKSECADGFPEGEFSKP